MKASFKPPKWLLFSILTIFVAQLFSQNANNSKPNTKPVYRYALKGYLNIFHEKSLVSETSVFNQTTVTSQIQTTFLPTFGISKQHKNGSFSEMSLTHFNFLHDDIRRDNTYFSTVDSLGNLLTIPRQVQFRYGTETWTNEIGIRWEYDYPVFYGKMGVFQPFFGISTDPSVFYEKKVPFSTGKFPTNVAAIRNTFSFIPRVKVALSSRLFLDVHCPIAVYSMALTYKKEENPILPTYARKSLDFSKQLFSSTFNFRIGLGYKI